MAFWGIEVEPGKPFTLRFDKARGRLRISKATLGIGLSEERSVVQCNVGKNTSPIFLCGLSPSKDQSCPLDLEFHEEDDVVFSVLGPRSVHLTGFYLGNVCSGGFTGKKKVEEVCNSGTGIRREPETVSQDAAADKLLITSEKRVKDSNIPKRPTSAYFIFMWKHHPFSSIVCFLNQSMFLISFDNFDLREEFRKTFKEKHPNNKSVSAVGKAGGDKWKSMSDAEKTVYVAEAEKRKIDYIKYMEAYNKNKAEGADTSDNEDEDEDTSESDEF